jgi:hypothetical protein
MTSRPTLSAPWTCIRTLSAPEGLSWATWLNVGGNQAIGYGGNAVTAGTTPYDDYDGGMAIRLLDTCDDESCNWLDDPALYMTSRRWYPTLETLEDGSAIILGGCQYGGYVNSGNTQNNPTVEVSRDLL